MAREEENLIKVRLKSRQKKVLLDSLLILNISLEICMLTIRENIYRTLLN